MKEPRRLQLLSSAPEAPADLPDWPQVPAFGDSVALTEVGGRQEALRFALQLADAWCELGRPPRVILCELDTVPRLTSEEAARFAIATRQLSFAAIRNREELVALAAQGGSDALGGPTLFVGDLAVHALGCALKIVIARERDPLAMTPRARALQASGALVLSSARAGVASLLAAGLAMPTPAP